MKRGNLIRPLTEFERKVAGKYFAQIEQAEAEVVRLRDVLSDVARVLVGRDAAVVMTTEGLYELDEEAPSGT